MSAGAVTVVAAIIRRDGRLLMAQRPDGVHLAGQWEFPGGKVEEGEALEAALARELREELGIEVEVGPLYLKWTHAYPERTVCLHFFECRISAGELENGSAATDWVLPEQLPGLDVPEGNHEVVRRLRRDA